MSLPQLIGMQCAACTKTISSVTDGTFCEVCGNPIHVRCLNRDAAPLDGKCPECAADPNSSIAKEVQRERGVEAQAREIGPSANYPVSKVCPKCQSAEFTRERPTGWIAFAWDRVCTKCGTRYSPPTPLWAAFVFLAFGLGLAGIGALGLMAGDVCVALVGILGVGAIIHGVRSLARPGQA